MEPQKTLNSQNSLEKDKKQKKKTKKTKLEVSQSQISIPQSCSNQNSIVLAQKQACKSTEQKAQK